jgi:hypothetical protein
MITDTEIRSLGLRALAEALSDVEAERFIALIQPEPFDYTEWRQSLPEEGSLEALDARAMALRNASAR